MLPQILLLAGLGFFGVSAWRRYTDPQGDATADCDKVEMNPMPSPDGVWVASAHSTVCSGFGGDAATYVYVHPSSEANSSDNLISRYFEHGGAGGPKIQWVTGRQLKISIPEVGQITKRIASQGSVSIAYEIGGQDYPQKR